MVTVVEQGGQKPQKLPPENYTFYAIANVETWVSLSKAWSLEIQQYNDLFETIWQPCRSKANSWAQLWTNRKSNIWWRKSSNTTTWWRTMRLASNFERTFATTHDKDEHFQQQSNSISPFVLLQGHLARATSIDVRKTRDQIKSQSNDHWKNQRGRRNEMVQIEIFERCVVHKYTRFQSAYTYRLWIVVQTDEGNWRSFWWRRRHILQISTIFIHIEYDIDDFVDGVCHYWWLINHLSNFDYSHSNCWIYFISDLLWCRNFSITIWSMKSTINQCVTLTSMTPSWIEHHIVVMNCICWIWSQLRWATV